MYLLVKIEKKLLIFSYYSSQSCAEKLDYFLLAMGAPDIKSVVGKKIIFQFSIFQANFNEFFLIIKKSFF